MPRTLQALALCAMLSTTLAAQAAAKKPIEGAWKVVEVVVTGAGASTNSAPQPGLYIFTAHYYSTMRDVGNKPRVPYKAEDPTSAEKLAAWDAFTAQTGTYEVSGSTLSLHPVVARWSNLMAGGSTRYEYRVEGSTLWLTQKVSDTQVNIGGKIVPSSGPASETRLKMMRVE